MASPDDMANAMVANMQAKTGRTIGEWQSLLGDWKERKHGEIVQYLKQEYGLTTGYAGMISFILRGGRDVFKTNGAELVAEQYSGPKTQLKPIYDKLVETVLAFGADVEISPKQSYVSLRRYKQFATIRAATRDRIDVGINLKNTDETRRLQRLTTSSAMVSHRVRVMGVQEVDRELVAWLRKAYEQS